MKVLVVPYRPKKGSFNVKIVLKGLSEVLGRKYRVNSVETRHKKDIAIRANLSTFK
jgi:hypothetical protein